MGKILKYCSSCEEGFAERFTFCPVCGASLQTFEMNLVSGEVVSTENPAEPVPEVIENDFAVADLGGEPVNDPAPPAFLSEAENEPAAIEEPEHIIEANAAGSYSQDPPTSVFLKPEAPTYIPARDRVVETAPVAMNTPEDEEFHVTVIREDNSKRNGLLLAATVFVVIVMLSSVVVSILGKDFDIGSIGDDNIVAYLPQDVPDEIEIEKPEVKKKDNAGGGGGGGNNEETPASKGAPPPMMEKPMVAPDARADRLTNPSLVQQVGVKGPNQPKIDVDQRYGVLNGADSASNGPGSGGGIGTGRGGGVGSGNGSGLGSGSGGGAGAGNGGGIGDGDGRGGGDPPPAIARGESTALNITSKPRANYTDAARQANVQGVVRLKVTFLANGQIGSISAVSGLPNGLTEQAIAAARGMRFEPKKVNGVPVAVARVVEYSFTIY